MINDFDMNLTPRGFFNKGRHSITSPDTSKNHKAPFLVALDSLIAINDKRQIVCCLSHLLSNPINSIRLLVLCQAFTALVWNLKEIVRVASEDLLHFR